MREDVIMCDTQMLHFKTCGFTGMARLDNLYM